MITSIDVLAHSQSSALHQSPPTTIVATYPTPPISAVLQRRRPQCTVSFAAAAARPPPATAAPATSEAPSAAIRLVAAPAFGTSCQMHSTEYSMHCCARRTAHHVCATQIILISACNLALQELCRPGQMLLPRTHAQWHRPALGAHANGAHIIMEGSNIIGIGIMKRPRPRPLARARPPLPRDTPASLVRFRAILMGRPPTSVSWSLRAFSTASSSRNSTYAYPLGCCWRSPGMVTRCTVPQLCMLGASMWAATAACARTRLQLVLWQPCD